MIKNNELDRESDEFQDALDKKKNKEMKDIKRKTTLELSLPDYIDTNLKSVARNLNDKLTIYDEIIDKHTHQIVALTKKMAVLEAKVSTAVNTITKVIAISGGIFTLINILLALYGR